MKITWANNAATKLRKPITSKDTIIEVFNSERFPDIEYGQEYFLITLEHPITHDFEICKVIKIDKKRHKLYVERGQEDTEPKSFPPGSLVENRITKGTLELFLHSGESLPLQRSIGQVLKVGYNNQLEFDFCKIIFDNKQLSLKSLIDYAFSCKNIDFNDLSLVIKNVTNYSNFFNNQILRQEITNDEILYKDMILSLLYYINEYDRIGNFVELCYQINE